MMRRVAPHLVLLSPRVSNCWLFTDTSGKRFLIDTGYTLEKSALRASLRAAGVQEANDLAGVLLTHRHSDHAGNAAWLRDTFKCPVFCHPDDAPFLRGERTPPRMSGTGKPVFYELLCRIEDRYPSRCTIDGVYEEGRWLWGFRVVPAPGHTEGSVMLFHEETATLFSGDVILAGYGPIRAIEKVRLADRHFTPDLERCQVSVRAFLREMPPVDTLCSGHGPVVHKGVREKLRALWV
jgi:glyoxylase-like metal-dependent hydrolase (beta-lactamase superfamily II)